MSIRLVLAEDNLLVREGLQPLLQVRPDIGPALLRDLWVAHGPDG